MTGTPEVVPAGNLVSEPAATSRTARFGVYQLDLGSGDLRRDGDRVKLQDQPFRLLTFLIEHAGEVVTREDLRERLWPTDFVDFDHSLNTAVRKLRAALDDSADSPRFVETLARRGYRFIAPVSWSGDAAVPPPAQTGGRRIPWLPVAIALVVLAGAAIATRITSRRATPAAPPITAIAVLPFTNSDPETQHVSDGISEILIDTLSPLPELRVMARTTVFRYKGRGIEPVHAGKELNVGAVVTGDVQRDRDGYAIRVDLIDVHDGTQLWGQRYRSTTAELPAVQSRIGTELSRNLRRRQLAKVYTPNPEAYDLYLKGLYAWNRRGEDDLKLAVSLFRQAIDRDLSYAAPHAGLANTYGVMVGSGILLPEQGVPMVMAAAHKALELDPDNAEAYVSIATSEFRNLWDFDAAERDFHRALALNPNYATGHQWYADFLRVMGRLAEARRESDTAYQLDPLSPAITNGMCWSYVWERRYREAIEFSHRVGAADERLRSNGLRRCEGQALMLNGDIEKAVAMMATSTQPDTTAVVAAYRRGGKAAMFRKRLEILSAQSAGADTPIEIAEIYGMLGEKDEAFAWLEKAYAKRISRLTNMTFNPAFDGIRDDPRFTDLLRRIGLPEISVQRDLGRDARALPVR